MDKQWFEEISPRHVKQWSKYVKRAYTNHLRLWLAMKGRKLNVHGQVNSYDNKKIGGKHVCYWYELATRWHKDGYNPLQVIALRFDEIYVKNRQEYLKPDQLFECDLQPSELDAWAHSMAEVSLRSDLAILERIKQQVEVDAGPVEDIKQLLAMTDLISEQQLHNQVLRASLLGEYEDKQKRPDIVCEFLFSPRTYLSGLKECLSPALRRLPTMEGKPIG